LKEKRVEKQKTKLTEWFWKRNFRSNKEMERELIQNSWDFRKLKLGRQSGSTA
jgi:hypothetical protein